MLCSAEKRGLERHENESAKTEYSFLDNALETLSQTSIHCSRNCFLKRFSWMLSNILLFFNCTVFFQNVKSNIPIMFAK